MRLPTATELIEAKLSKVKLSGTKSIAADSSSSKFMTDYHDRTHPNPIDPYSRAVALKSKSEGQPLIHFQSELRPTDHDTVHISWLQSDPAASGRTRGTGVGSHMLKRLTGIADAHGVALTLSPKRAPGMDKDIGLSQSSLRSWYKRHGFADADSGLMRRTPQKP